MSSNVRQWLSDSVEHWDGATLVVETTNFNECRRLLGGRRRMYGWDRNMHVVERFSLLDANTILYRFKVEDPTVLHAALEGRTKHDPGVKPAL